MNVSEIANGDPTIFSSAHSLALSSRCGEQRLLIVFGFTHLANRRNRVDHMAVRAVMAEHEVGKTYTTKMTSCTEWALLEAIAQRLFTLGCVIS